MQVTDFDFDLPGELIAQYPAPKRTDSRLLYLHADQDQLIDAHFSKLSEFLTPGDVLVLNNTRVIKARLNGNKESGGKVEILVERILDDKHCIAQVKASHSPKNGSRLYIASDLTATVLDKRDTFYTLRFHDERSVSDLLDCYGSVPLPPYIERDANPGDDERYQTVYAQQPGAVAAPTAGLHFDETLLEDLAQAGITLVYLTLHVGAGTFQPIRVEKIAEHKMHSERYHISAQAASLINDAKRTGRRVCAVGTTTLRALEAAAQNGVVDAGENETDMFITPGYKFRIVDLLITNFHLPKTTLLMLVAAFGGVQAIRNAYAHAIAQRYRFFSYGDAMLIVKKSVP